MELDRLSLSLFTGISVVVSRMFLVCFVAARNRGNSRFPSTALLLRSKRALGRQRTEPNRTDTIHTPTPT
jgi:hypothetical protein